jgi:CDGSH iron-sulfur domain-containing protein 3
MSEVVIKTREDGPLLVTGPVTLVDHLGNKYELNSPNIALCRCGHSNKKPFCDGTHRSIGWCGKQLATPSQQQQQQQQ